jgi:hypothetical protein
MEFAEATCPPAAFIAASRSIKAIKKQRNGEPTERNRMSFDIREFAGKPEAVLYAVENYRGLDHESVPLAKPAIEALREVIRRLGNCTPTIVFKARGYVTSEGSAEIEIHIRTIPSMP